MALWSCITRSLSLQAVGLVPEDRANGAKPMETDTDGPNKRRRITNRVYVGSSDLSYRRGHMEVCSTTCAAISWHSSCAAVCSHKMLSSFADCKTCRWRGLCIKDYIKTWMLSRSFGSMPSSEFLLTCNDPEALCVASAAASPHACAMIA